MKRLVLEASEGMVYTDGSSGGKRVYLAEGASADGWFEVPEEEFIRAMEQGNGLNAAGQEEFLAALREFGVNV